MIEQSSIDNFSIDKSKWKKVILGDVVYEPKESVKDPVAEGIEHVIGLEHIDSDDIHLRRSASIKESITFTKKFNVGDVLFGRRRAYLKKAAQASFAGICSGDITVMRTKNNLIPELLPFIVNNEKFFDYAITHSAGGLSPRVKFKDLANYEFLLPPNDKQEDLVSLFASNQKFLDLKRATLDKLNVTYLSLLENKLIDKSSDKVFFSSFGDVIRGVGYKPDELIEEYSDKACIILRANNIKESKINFDDIKILSIENVKSQQLLKAGDFAICMSNGSKELVGKAAQLDKVINNVAVGSFCAAFRPNNEENRELLEHLLSSESYRFAIKRILTGSTINNLKSSDIECLFLRVKMNTSKEVISKLNQLKLNIKKHDEDIRNLKQLQKCITRQVF